MNLLLQYKKLSCTKENTTVQSSRKTTQLMYLKYFLFKFSKTLII